MQKLPTLALVFATIWVALPLRADDSLPACKLLSNSEIKQIAGDAVADFLYTLPRNGSKVGVGSECEVPGFGIQLDATPVARYREQMKLFGKSAQFESVAGIGDEANFFVQGGSVKTAGIFARSGKHTFAVSRLLAPGETPTSVRPMLESLAKAVAAKLK